MRKQSFVLLVAGLLVVACGPAQPRPLLPELPTAVQPRANQLLASQGGAWAISFLHEFPADFWSSGPHEYALVTRCPILTGGGETATRQTFAVTEDAPLYNGPIYLRLGGLSQDVTDQIVEPIQSIHPQQPTVAVVTFPGLPQEVLEAMAQECEVIVAWDGESNVETLKPQTPFEPAP